MFGVRCQKWYDKPSCVSESDTDSYDDEYNDDRNNRYNYNGSSNPLNNMFS